MMFAVALGAVLIALGLAIARSLAGPTVFDRVLAVNSTGTLAVVVLALIGFVVGRPEFLDLAILYVLLNIVGTIAVLRFVRAGHLGDPRDDAAKGIVPGEDQARLDSELGEDGGSAR